MNAERAEDVLLEEGQERLAGDALDDQPGDDIAGVRILPLRAGLEVERLACPAVDDHLRGRRVRHRLEAVILRPVILQARRVAEQLADGDPLAAGDPGNIFGDRVVEREAALIAKDEDGGGGELLGHGGDLVERVGRGFAQGRRLRAVGAGEDDPAAANDRDRGRGHARRFERAVDQRVDPRGLGRRELLGGGRRRAGDEQEKQDPAEHPQHHLIHPLPGPPLIGKAEEKRKGPPTPAERRPVRNSSFRARFRSPPSCPCIVAE